MPISINITENQMRIMLEYAETNGMTIDDLIDELTERIEDEMDAKIADEGVKRYLKNKDTVTFEEAVRELGLE